MPGVSSFNTRTGAVTLLSADVDALMATDFSIYPLASPALGVILRKFGGTPGTNETNIFHGVDTNGYSADGFHIQCISGQIGVTATAAIWFTTGGPGGAKALNLSSSSGNVQCADNFQFATISDDVGLKRVAAGIWRTTNGGAGDGWLQQTAGEAALTAAFTDATGVLTATNLSRTLKAGRSYRIEGVLQVSNSTATEGAQFDFNGGTATATTFFAAATPVGSVTAGTQSATALNGVLNYTVVTGTDYVIIRGYIKVNAGGTITLRAAENTSAVGTMTLGIGSWLAFYDTNPL